jgi:hypothetical protein
MGESLSLAGSSHRRGIVKQQSGHGEVRDWAGSLSGRLVMGIALGIWNKSPDSEIGQGTRLVDEGIRGEIVPDRLLQDPEGVSVETMKPPGFRAARAGTWACRNICRL